MDDLQLTLDLPRLASDEHLLTWYPAGVGVSGEGRIAENGTTCLEGRDKGVNCQSE